MSGRPSGVRLLPNVRSRPTGETNASLTTSSMAVSPRWLSRWPLLQRGLRLSSPRVLLPASVGVVGVSGLDRGRPAERPSSGRARVSGPVGGSNRLLSVAELAVYLGVPKKTVYACWRAWGLPGYRVGRHLRFRARQVEDWLDRQEV
jgi:excisionase family DNA binding protein